MSSGAASGCRSVQCNRTHPLWRRSSCDKPFVLFSPLSVIRRNSPLRRCPRHSRAAHGAGDAVVAHEALEPLALVLGRFKRSSQQGHFNASPEIVRGLQQIAGVDAQLSVLASSIAILAFREGKMTACSRLHPWRHMYWRHSICLSKPAWAERGGCSGIQRCFLT